MLLAPRRVHGTSGTVVPGRRPGSDGAENCGQIRSNTMVAWILSPPPRPLLPDDAVVIVWSR